MIVLEFVHVLRLHHERVDNPEAAGEVTLFLQSLYLALATKLRLRIADLAEVKLEVITVLLFLRHLLLQDASLSLRQAIVVSFKYDQIPIQWVHCERLRRVFSLEYSLSESFILDSVVLEDFELFIPAQPDEPIMRYLCVEGTNLIENLEAQRHDA